MGTRNLSICQQGNKLKIKQYGQWDGYPSGQGITILKFCQNKSNLEKLKIMLSKITMDWEDQKDYINEYDKLCPNYSNELDLRTKEMKYHFQHFCSRDVGGEIFNNIINCDANKLPKCFKGKIYLQEYERESEYSQYHKGDYLDMWIEYAYVINFDMNTLDCYGFGWDGAISFSLDNLPTEKQFIEKLENLENE